MSNAFAITIMGTVGIATTGRVTVERTGKSYDFEYHNSIDDTDGAPFVVLFHLSHAAKIARRIPATQLLDVRHAIREHFKPSPLATVPASIVKIDVADAEPRYIADTLSGRDRQEAKSLAMAAGLTYGGAVRDGKSGHIGIVTGRRSFSGKTAREQAVADYLYRNPDVRADQVSAFKSRKSRTITVRTDPTCWHVPVPGVYDFNGNPVTI